MHQMLHFLHSLKHQADDITTRTLFKSRCMQEAGLNRGISMFYWVFQSSDTKLPLQLAWEVNLGKVISDKDWT